MIPITKDYNNVPNKLNYINEPLASAYADLLANKNNHKFKSHIYPDGSIEKLKDIYNDKCGYCETITAAGAELRVDHYRPKDKVKDDPTHLTGYYWLSYEWSNLILACEKCNGAKSNKFPIAATGQRCLAPIKITGSTDLDKTTFIPTHSSLINEQPLIINPELETNLTNWFIFLPSGEIQEVRGNVRIRETINVCKLNRPALILDRKKILDDIVNKIERFLNDFLVDNDSGRLSNRLHDLFDDLFLLSEVKNKYSRFSYFLYLKFNLFIAGKFGAKSSSLINNLYFRHRLAKLGF